MSLAKESPTFTSVLAAVDALAPTIAERAAEIEAARRIPTDLLVDLIDTGCFRLALPASHGGVGSDLVGALRVFETLARADASVAWIALIGGGGWCDLAGLPRATFDELYAKGPDTIIAGAFNPTGSATPCDGGYRISGRWSFVSGCEHADWVYGHCVEGIVDGAPVLRMAVLSPDQVVIEDTWHVCGMSGTGSHHIRVEEAFVPRERTFETLTAEPCLDAPVLRIPLLALYSTCMASVAVGIARGALDDITAIAGEKVPLFAGGPLGTDPVFHLDLASADAELRAARALLHEGAEIMWVNAVNGEDLSLEDRARLRAAAVWAARRAVSVVTAAYRSGGGTSIYKDCALQRRLRDIHTMTQHFLLRDDTMLTAGAILAGREPEIMLF